MKNKSVEKVLATVALIVSFIAIKATFGSEIKCYYGQTRNNEAFPSNAQLLPFGSEGYPTYCYKLYENSTMINLFINRTTETSNYYWGGSDIDYFLSKFVKCDDVLEASEIELQYDGNITTYRYKRYCFCCGEACNNASFDAKCRKEAQNYTHHCYYQDESKTPQLPSTALLMPCTDSQVCYKESLYVSEGISHYSWGCASLGHVGSCGQSTYYEDANKLYKGCTCCGSECNGAEMDKITADNTLCSEVTTTMTTPPITTTIGIPTTKTSSYYSTSKSTTQSSAAAAKPSFSSLLSTIISLLFISSSVFSITMMAMSS